jgi:hypothetical protein
MTFYFQQQGGINITPGQAKNTTSYLPKQRHQVLLLVSNDSTMLKEKAKYVGEGVGETTSHTPTPDKVPTTSNRVRSSASLTRRIVRNPFPVLLAKNEK